MSLFDWQPHLKEMMSHLIVHYPHVVDKLQEIWGTSDGAEYLIDLLEYSPEKNRIDRQGFSWEAVFEIQNILEEHENQFPDLHKEFANRKNNWRTT